MASNISCPEVEVLAAPSPALDPHHGLRAVSSGGRNSKRPFICTMVRRMLGMKMATCSQNSRTLYMSIKSALDTALTPLTASATAAIAVRGGESAGTPVCPLCRCLMIRPVCLPCGHSLCKPCLARSTNNHPLFSSHRNDAVCARCPRCQQSWPVVPPGMEEDRRPTVVLQNAFIRWYPGWAECCKYREEGNRVAQEGDFPLAVQYYNKALETGIPDHRVLSNRSRAYLAMERLSEALADTELCCKLKPTWPKGHFRRGAVLERLGQWEEALAAYFLCLYFSNGSTDVTPIICQIIDRHLPDRNCASFATHLTSQVVEKCRTRLAATSSPQSTTSATNMTTLEEEEEDKIPQHLLDESDFECILCTGLLDRPVTVACGHSFCQDCLARSFDHTPYCPVCRSPLAEGFVQYARMSGKMNVDELLEAVLQKHFRAAYDEKGRQREADRVHKLKVGVSEKEDLPVFVCTMAFPNLPCPLHVFEPQYRLMLRRCVESGGRRFGMCFPTHTGSFSSYGTVLYINTVEHTADGRSLITTTGEKRFEILSRSTCDGYNTARVRFIEDRPVTDPQEIVSLRALQQEVFDHAKQWLEALPVYARLLLTQTVCCPLPGIDPHPENCPSGPMWVWWYVNALPTTPQRKITFFKLTSLRQRLLMLKDSLHLPTIPSAAANGGGSLEEVQVTAS